MNTNIKKLQKSEIEIDFELTAEEFQKHFERALEQLKNHVKMDGFRKGHVPVHIVEQKMGNENILMEAGDLALKVAYPKFIKENNLEPVSEPEVKITKIAKGSEFLFTVKVAVLPEIQLPDYKAIAKTVKTKEIHVDEKEVEDTIGYLQKSRAKFTTENRPAMAHDFVEIEYQNNDVNGGKPVKDRFILGEGGFLKDFEDNVIGMSSGQEKEFTAKFPENTTRKDLAASGEPRPDGRAGKDATFRVKMLSVQKMELAEINDEFAKTLGAFDSMVALKENVKEGIALEKKESEKQRARGEMLERISEKTAFDIPEKMVEFEKQRLLEDLKNQVTSQFKIPFGEYLSSVKKTEDEIKNSFKLEAEKRIKKFLVLRQIGRKETIEVSEEELAQDAQKLMKNYTPEQLKKIDISQLKEYSKGAIFNEKVFQLLEKLSH